EISTPVSPLEARFHDKTAANSIALRSLALANRRASNTRNSNEHPASTPLHAQNLSTRVDTLTIKSARADRASGARIALFAKATRSTHARTTCEAARRCPRTSTVEPPPPQRRADTTHAPRRALGAPTTRPRVNQTRT